MGNKQRPLDALFYAAAVGVTLALILGGGAKTGYLSDAVLQACSVPLLLACLWRLTTTSTTNELKGAAVFCALLVLVPMLQVVPVPPGLWTRLPDRQPIVETFALLGRPLPWRPLSVSPQATWLSALSLIVPLAIFLATALLDLRERRLLTLVLLIVGLVSVFLGLSQVAQGPTSALRFFDFNNAEAVGFFANRNHFAALLYSLALFAAAWAVSFDGDGKSLGRKYDVATLVPAVASFTVFAVLLAAQAVVRSRAGLGLTIIALFGAFALAAAAKRRRAGNVSGTRVLGAAIALAAMFAVQFALYRVMERFAMDPLEDARVGFAQTTFEAARSFMPFGSGMGTFVRVYGLFERAQDVLPNIFANRAHNDFLEIGLEAGAIGLALMAAFIVWLVWRGTVLWTSKTYGQLELDQALARAATLVLALLIAHSFVDYPLRTAAVMAVFALACGLLIQPPPRATVVAERLERTAETSVKSAWPSPEQYGLGRPGAIGEKRWGESIDWPEEWRPRHNPDEN